MSGEFKGVLFIGDPHLASRVPGFRRDDYPRAILEKLKWALDYARDNALVPAVLGDLFHFPRDNANWLLGEVIALLHGRGVLSIFGNHDYNDGTLKDDDSFSVICAAGVVNRVDLNPWRGVMAGRDVVIGGTSHGERFVREFARPSAGAMVMWMTHHDLLIPGYEESAKITPKEVEGVDLVVNGHIHRHLEDVVKGGTRYMTPGNIARVNRSDAGAQHVPSVLRVLVHERGYEAERIAVPHRAFEEVFYEAVVEAAAGEGTSSFVSGLAELQARSTAGGEGLREFLSRNCGQFDEDVRRLIDDLAREVLDEREEA